MHATNFTPSLPTSGHAVTPPPRPLAAAPAPDHADHLQGLFDQAAATDDPVRQRRLRVEVITAYLPAARSVASRFRGRGVE